MFSLGVVTDRDEWVYDFEEGNLSAKVKFFIDTFESEKERFKALSGTQKINDFVDRKIKWTSELEDHLKNGALLKFAKKNIRVALYRPFVKHYTYFDRIITHRLYQQDKLFPIGQPSYNVLICVNIGSKTFNVLSTNLLPDYHVNGDCNCIPLYLYDEHGTRHDNITDWGLEHFRNQYKNKKITKEDIFHYTYAVLHDPGYRKKYELDLKRGFPRLPFYEDFRQWRDWGKVLMWLHINYEDAEPYPLKREDKDMNPPKKQKELFGTMQSGDEKLIKDEPKLKVKLKADKAAGTIEIDEQTTLSEVPAEAWEYNFGNRSALEWVLEQYKERKPSDPTIAEKFNTYRFADYKEQVIELLKKVCTVSVETIKVISSMKQ